MPAGRSHNTEGSGIPALQVGSRNSSMFPLGMFLAGRMLDRFGLSTLCPSRRRKAHGPRFLILTVIKRQSQSLRSRP